MRDKAPVEPVAQGDDDTTLAERTAAYEKEKERWERSDRVALMVMDLTISPTIRGALEKEPKSAKSFMTSIEEYFKGSTKSNASTLLSQLMSAKYNGQGNVREHIMGMVDIRDKLKDMDCPLNDATLLHHVMISLPPVFEPFKVNYNGSDKQWDITTLVSKCAQEEQRLRSQHPDLVNHVSQDGSKNKNKMVFRSKKDKKGKKPYDGPKRDGPILCFHCKQECHITKDCDRFKEWCIKNGNDGLISIVDESFYAYFLLSTW